MRRRNFGESVDKHLKTQLLLEKLWPLGLINDGFDSKLRDDNADYITVSFT